MTWKFSRSHQSSLHECPRLCWLRYYADGRGYESRKINVAQSTGTLLHSIIGSILAEIRASDTIPGDGFIDQAVQTAIMNYRQTALQRGLDISQEGSLEFELQRQAALAEGLARAWVRVRLPGLVARYRVVAVEEEWEVALDAAGEIVCMVRIDAVLEDRDSRDLWAFEMKTTGWMSDDWLEKWRYDSQTLMHCWAIERHMGRPCAGVIVEAFYKGTKRKREDTGEDVYYSPLIHGYVKKGVPPFDEDEFSWDSANARRKGWESVDVWQGYSPKTWIAMLPEEILQAQLFSIEVFRSPGEIETWVRQTIIEQKSIQYGVEKIVARDGDDWYMDDTFPSRLNADCYSNKYRRRCLFLPVCFQGIEPVDSDLYIERTAHHPNEFAPED
jgi:hypothetical protein